MNEFAHAVAEFWHCFREKKKRSRLCQCLITIMDISFRVYLIEKKRTSIRENSISSNICRPRFLEEIKIALKIRIFDNY